jgi:hypothetical protein
VPVLACPSVAIDETQGTLTTAGRLYCVRINPSVGLHMYYGLHRGHNFETRAATSDYDAEGGAYTPPVYMRCLGEREQYAQEKWRATTSLAVVLKRSKSCAMRYGLST